MPGVLIVEALAQTGAVAILSTPENKGKIAFFGGIQNCRFKGMVFPGDVLRLETKIIRQKGPVGIGKAVASVDGKVVVSSRIDVYGRRIEFMNRKNIDRKPWRDCGSWYSGLQEKWELKLWRLFGG